MNNVSTTVYLENAYRNLLLRVDNMSTVLFNAIENFDKKQILVQNQLNQVRTSFS